MKVDMRTQTSEAGFSLVELLTATTISLIVLGTAMAAFKDAVSMNDTATNLSDASQNLRSGMNFLVRDLVQAGHMIPTGGIPIPSGANSVPILRPSPPTTPPVQLYFDNVNSTTLTAITTGQALGPAVDSQATDMVTIMTGDPILDACLGTPLSVNVSTQTDLTLPILAADGSSFSVGTKVGCASGVGGWLVGNPTQGQPPVQAGDLLLFTDPNGKNAMQTVTSTDATHVFFAASTNALDTFKFNQRGAAAGTITQLLGQALTVQRVLMYTYYVDFSTDGQPHLMRQLNNYPSQALAGIVEDLEMSYDIVDGVVNPTGQKTLPVTINSNLYSANQIRTVYLHVGVRSEAMSTKQHDYLRSHMSTVVNLRNLAYIDRYK
jgi:Tfp pilus assembly protein FimT